MYYGINSTKQRGNAYIFIGIVGGIFFSMILFYFAFQPKTTVLDLVVIKGELVNANAVQMVKKQIGRDNKSTVISLKGYPDKQFNIGENISLSKFEQLINNQSKPIYIELLTTKRFLEFDRPITPTFHGLKINDKVILSASEGIDQDNSNRIIAKIVGVLNLIFGIVMTLYGIKIKGANKCYE